MTDSEARALEDDTVCLVKKLLNKNYFCWPMMMQI